MITQLQQQPIPTVRRPKALPLPKVAVLMAVCRKDTPDLFRGAVESILGQDYPSALIRIYLGVDGPVDPDVEEYVARGRRFHRIIRNRSNLGLTRTLNRLVQVLEDEEFVFRMDSDDVSLPGRFKTQVEFLHGRPDIDVVGGGIVEVDERGKGLCSRRYPVRRDELRRYICKANPLAHVTVCFRRSFFLKVPQYPGNYRLNQDLALWYRVLSKHIGVTNIDECLVKVRVSDDLLARRGLRNSLVEFAIYVKGIWGLYGLTWRYVYPIARLLFRLLPVSVTSSIYRSRFRMALNHRD